MKIKKSLAPYYRKLKAYLNYLAGNGIYFKIDKHVKTEYLGDKHCGWKIKEGSINKESIVYSLGLGSNISFEIDTIKKHNCTLFAFDPTPKSIEFVEKNTRQHSR